MRIAGLRSIANLHDGKEEEKEEEGEGEENYDDPARDEL